MPNKSAFSAVGLSHKVCLAAEAQGYTPELLNALAEDKNLFKQLLQVQSGFAEIKFIGNIIDCDAGPFVPDGWSVKNHRKGGLFRWDIEQTELWLSPSQRKPTMSISGEQFFEELALHGQIPFNANVLDYLLLHQHLIDEWKKSRNIQHQRLRIPFFGTIYCYRDGRECIRYLFEDKTGKWNWSSDWVDGDCCWDDDCPAAVYNLSLYPKNTPKVLLEL